MSDEFAGLSAYLSRIGLNAPPDPDARGLAALQRAHRLAVAFENLDIPLGRGISIDPNAIFDKLVTRQRGGYCFEQNGLFLRALQALGFDARMLLARVWLMADGVPPRTHCLALVRIADEEWIADAGFGASYSPPMRLIEGAEYVAPDGTRHRLIIDPDHGWLLQRAGPAGATDGRSEDHSDWQPQYSFTLDKVAPADLEIDNHWTSTRPDTRFTTLRVASRILPDGFMSLLGRQLTTYRSGVSEIRELTGVPDAAKVLNEDFGIRLSLEEVERLGLFSG